MNTIRKAHARLALLNGSITTLILVTMTLGYLFISENGMMRNKIYSCANDIRTITSYIEQQDIVSGTWLSQLEAGDKYCVSLLDNGARLLYGTNQLHESGKRQQIIDRAWNYYNDKNFTKTDHAISYRSSYASFSMNAAQVQTEDGTYATLPEAYCSVISIDKNDTTIQFLLAAPLDGLQREIVRQRLLFLGIGTPALIAIWISAWVFTGKLLKPVEENRRRQNEFIASASHELRTPLAVILSCAETMLSKKSSAELSTIKDESMRTSRLLNDMLTLLGHDTGRLDIKPENVQLDTLLLDTCESFEAMAAEKHISITASLPDDALPCCICDGGRIVQVLEILLHNAVSYTPKGGKIRLSLLYHHSHGRHFEIRVSDTGIGISDAEKPKIFDRFYRSEKARSDKNHFGLGLSIAYDIVSAHHGTIKAADTPGGGTTFIIMLK